MKTQPTVTVYALIHDMGYDGHDLMGVYASRDLAEIDKAHLCALQDDRYWKSYVNQRDTMHVSIHFNSFCQILGRCDYIIEEVEMVIA